MNSASVGIVLLVLGSGVLLMTLILLRLAPHLNAGGAAPPTSPTSHPIAPHNEAVLLIQSGGRIAYMNPAARELFNVWDDEPNLESLARRARPSEAFLMLCAGEGQARFSLNGRFVEGTSYATPGLIGRGPGYSAGVLVSLRRPALVLDGDSALGGRSARSNDGNDAGSQGSRSTGAPVSEGAAQALNIFTELSQAMSRSLDLEETLITILESCERLLPSDFLEITLWDVSGQQLIPYRLVGLTGVDRRLEKAAERYPADSGYSGYLAGQRRALFVPDINTYRQVRPNLDRQRFPYRSYLGAPLLLADELIGTLELASLAKENYTENDLQVLQLLGGQAAVALKNALLYKQELERSTELAGLANLAQTVSAIRDPQDLYNRLVESLAPLLNVEILGFLVYDETRHMLEGQMPFKGIHPDLIHYCQTVIQPDSPGETVWQSGDPVIADNAAQDERIQALDLQGIAVAAGMRGAVLLPLASGGRVLGYLLAANKRDSAAFDQNDLRFLAIVAGQAAPIIENANLVQQSRRRAQRAETLRRITSLTGSTATVEEILKFSLLDLARLLQADMAAIFLLDEARGELHVHRASTFGIAPEMIARLGRLPIDDPMFPLTVTGSKQQFFTSDLAEAGLIPSLYYPLVDDMKVHSLIDVPLVVRERGIGELLVGHRRANFFTNGDLQTAATAAGQLAVAIERSNLYSQTDQGLRQRVEQLTALTRVSRELNTTLKLDDLLQRVFDEALHVTHAACGTIILFDLELAAALPQPGGRTVPPILFQFGDPPVNGLHPMEASVLEDGEPLIVADFSPNGAQAGTPAGGPNTGDLNPSGPSTGWQPAHPGVRSAMVVPIAYQGQVAGLIHLHARAAGHFGESEREITEALAVQAAIALGNANRFIDQRRRTEDLNRRVESLSKIFEVSQVLGAQPALDEALEAIAFAIQSATPFEVVLISVYQADGSCLQRVVGAGIPLSEMAELRAHPAPWESIRHLMQADYRLGRSYFIPADSGLEYPADIHYYDAAPAPTNGHGAGERAWQADDMLMAPLLNAAGEPLGLISVDAPRDNRRPDPATIETLEIFCGQAALVIENQTHLAALKGSLAGLEGELEAARQAAADAQQHLPVLLHKDLERTLAMQQLGQRARRVSAGLDITEIIGRQKTRTDVLRRLSEETLARMELDVVLLAEPIQGGLSLTSALGSLPAEANPKALLGQRNPLRQALQSGEPLLVSDLGESQEWQNAPLLRALEARSFFCLPVYDRLPGSADGSAPVQPGAALLGISQGYTAPFTAEDRQLFELMTRQVAIALQNLHLLDETYKRLNEVNLLMNFSRQLGSLDPAAIMKTLLDSALSAVPAAQMGMVALWDARQGRLTPQAAAGYPRVDELTRMVYQSGEGLPGQALANRQALNVAEVEFTRHYNLSAQNLLHYRNATGGRMPVSSLAVPIMAGMDSGRGSVQDSQVTQARIVPHGVLVLDSAQTPAAFSDNDLAVLTSLAQQTALTLENARLYQGARRRSNQLQALTRVATTITSSLRSEQLTASLLDQLQSILPYDTGTLWLREGSNQLYISQIKPGRMVIRAARGFADSELRLGLAVDIQDSALLNEMSQTGRPIWVGDVRKDLRFQAMTLADYDQTEGSGSGFERLSWLGLPLIASGVVIGVIALEKTEAGYYSAEDIQVAANFAGQAAVGLVNAELYEESIQRAAELDQRSQTLTILNRLSHELSGSMDIARILDFAVQEFMLLMNCSAASAVTFEQLEPGPPRPGNYRATLQAEYPYADTFSPYLPGSTLPNAPIFDRLRESQGIFNTGNAANEADLSPLREFLAAHDSGALLIVPMISAGAPGSEATELQFLGLLMAHGAIGQRFEATEVELARTISNQVAIALQNAHLLAETLSLTDDLEQRVQERTAELGRERQRAETLLRIISELSASLDLDQVLNRTLTVLSEFVDAAQITILIARPGERKLHRLASIGYTEVPATDGSSTPLNVDEGLAGWIIRQRQSAMIPDVLEDERWVRLPFDSNRVQEPAFLHRSAMGVPLMSGAEALGCLLLFHPEVNHFSIDQLEMVQAAANQVAVAVNNAELYRLIRDQAEDLGTMLRNQQIETSRSKAILEAVADGVLVTDAQRSITLFNRSAEVILSMERSQVLGKSLEQFSGLFGRATHTWMETINTWSQDTAAYHSGDTFSEQITLEDGRVIGVRLAPVILRSDFLGTVSIFQDITHQVELDRLKSEFVATVSHELRTPMTSIKGYVEILLMGAAGALSDQQQHFLQVVKTNTERLSVLVNDLLDISQIESGKVTLARQPLNLDELADQALADLERRIQGESKQVRIVKEGPANLPRVLADPGRIRRILDNLLDNAFQYNLPDGQITLRLKTAGEQVQVDIQDTGVGIHPADQEHVFERFFRGESTLTLGVSGTGLGLAIVRNLIDMHGGRIWLTSSGISGQGSTFSFTLPVYKPETPPQGG
ncbi:MAG: GAF domain-containing protein [Chloroflexota bacterium]